MLNFTITELCKSATADKLRIKNVPDSTEVTDNLLKLILEVLQPLREKLAKPVVITSGYRCFRLNQAVGGVTTSQHLKGQAADIHVPGMTTPELFNYIKNSGIVYDQLINEYDQWVHVSYNKDKNRMQAFKL